MQIKFLKKGELIYQNTETVQYDEDGDVIGDLLPSTLVEVQAIAIDTLNWVAGENIKKATGNFTLLSASNSKAIALIAKVVSSLNPDTTTLTADELSAWNGLIALYDSGYADSQLLNTSINAIQTELTTLTDKVTRVSSATTIDEVVAILNE